MSRRDWGRPGVPWYAKREASPGALATSAISRAKLRAYFERNGTLYSFKTKPLAADAYRPDPGESTEVAYEQKRHEGLSVLEHGPRGQAQLHADNRFTLSEVAVYFGVSRERARQLEASALRKCRETLERLESDAELRMLRDRLQRAA